MKSSTLIRFSWNTVIGYFSYDCEKSIEFLKAWYLQYTIPKKYLNLAFKIQKSKDCWLENPTEFFTHGATANEKCIYLHLASKRNWMDYEEYGTTSVPLYIVEEIYNVEKIRNNPLIDYDVTTEQFKLKY